MSTSIDDEWPVSEEDTTVEDLDDTLKWTKADVDSALDASCIHRCPTLPSFPAPPSSKGPR